MAKKKLTKLNRRGKYSYDFTILICDAFSFKRANFKGTLIPAIAQLRAHALRGKNLTSAANLNGASDSSQPREHKHQQQNNKSQECPEENLYKHISKHI